MPPLPNLPILSVGDLSSSLKRVVEDAFSYVRVRGEISGLKAAPSGHVYLTLKDQEATIAAVCWRTLAEKLTFQPIDGLEVICSGRITTFSGKSQYQLVIESIEPAGIGALMALLEQRKKQLQKEGLFDPARKKKLPFLPETIGIITSPTGAVIRDMIHRVRERFPRRILLWPVLVQGEHAAEQITRAIDGFNALSSESGLRPDLLIVARGGGSIEDLWAFNEENVVRAAARSHIPLISAIGHEPDTTLLDFAADLRAPTPTAAAELAVPLRSECRNKIEHAHARLTHQLHQRLELAEHKTRALARSIPNLLHVVQTKTQHLDHWTIRITHSMPRIFERAEHSLLRLSDRLHGSLLEKEIQKHIHHLQALHARLARSYTHQLERAEQKLKHHTRLLESFHYTEVLKRGFVLVRDAKQTIQPRAATLAHTPLTLEFFDGTLSVTRADAPHTATPKRRTKKTTDSTQGTLWE